jgi:hypothetical protein
MLSKNISCDFLSARVTNIDCDFLSSRVKNIDCDFLSCDFLSVYHLELYTCSLIENCVRAFNIILSYMYYLHKLNTNKSH